MAVVVGVRARSWAPPVPAGLAVASQVYLGVHWATDVTAAAGLGAAWVLTLIAGHVLLRHRSARGKPTAEENLA
ncbi:hypothetical protein ACFVYA_31575 [Amycolatopsis sp. NPDC058278]|uniref:hypothetical protein n=1 Tax=Amycolatopsis sp. NPDC058278 TaxID=3346417 RepID=UPI0036DF30D1